MTVWTESHRGQWHKGWICCPRYTHYSETTHDRNIFWGDVSSAPKTGTFCFLSLMEKGAQLDSGWKGRLAFYFSTDIVILRKDNVLRSQRKVQTQDKTKHQFNSQVSVSSFLDGHTQHIKLSFLNPPWNHLTPCQAQSKPSMNISVLHKALKCMW